jgi:hypothetical protein
MFLVYTAVSGNNVTLSPRTASGYNQPTLNSAAQVTLLEGSGVSNGVMTANVKCKSPSSVNAFYSFRVAYCSGWLTDTQAPTVIAGLVGQWISSLQKGAGFTHLIPRMDPRIPTPNQFRFDNTPDTTYFRGTLPMLKVEVV